MSSSTGPGSSAASPSIVAYLAVELTVVGAVAFVLGVFTDAPLAAVGGAVLLMILCAILDSITALGDLRHALPQHYAFAWSEALSPTIDWSDMVNGALWSLGYAIVGDLGRRLALPAQGHHELGGTSARRCSPKKASIRRHASAAATGSGPTWESRSSGRASRGPLLASLRKL